MRRETLRRVLALPAMTAQDRRDLILEYLKRSKARRRFLLLRDAPWSACHGRISVWLYALTPDGRASIVVLPWSGPRASLGALVRECRRWTSETIPGLDS